MSSATLAPRKNRRLLLLEHCLGASGEHPRPAARDRLDAALGEDLSRRLVGALTRTRATS